MEKLIFAQPNNRDLNFLDKIFGISAKADEMAKREGKDKVINATIGSLMDDEGQLIVFESVIEELHKLSPREIAAYAPISGIPGFIDVVQKYTFGDYRPDMYTAACATPGGTGAIKLTIENYSNIGDTVLTSDWYWATYKNIATQCGRKLDTYELINSEGNYNIEAFEKKVAELIEKQECLAIIINTPAHNPTGFSLTNEDWDAVIDIVNKYAVNGKKITILADIAYIDFTENPAEARSFMKKFEKNSDSVLALAGYSASKGFTLYGMRCGALVCMTNSEEICNEFKNVCTFSARATWSNGTRGAQQVLLNMYVDESMKEWVDRERHESNQMLLRRGKIFEAAAKECGLEMVPFDAGFFASIPCKDPDEVAALLFPKGLFIVPLARGLRVAISAINEEQCKFIPKMIKDALDEYYGK